MCLLTSRFGCHIFRLDLHEAFGVCILVRVAAFVPCTVSSFRVCSTICFKTRCFACCLAALLRFQCHSVTSRNALLPVVAMLTVCHTSFRAARELANAIFPLTGTASGAFALMFAGRFNETATAAQRWCGTCPNTLISTYPGAYQCTCMPP